MLAAALAALIPVTAVGTAQARAMIDWPDAAGLVGVVRPMTLGGGHFLVETTDVLQYYLPNTTWQQWSDTASNSPQYYLQRIRRHYYSVIVLGYRDQLVEIEAVAAVLDA